MFSEVDQDQAVYGGCSMPRTGRGGLGRITPRAKAVLLKKFGASRREREDRGTEVAYQIALCRARGGDPITLEMRLQGITDRAAIAREKRRRWRERWRERFDKDPEFREWQLARWREAAANMSPDQREKKLAWERRKRATDEDFRQRKNERRAALRFSSIERREDPKSVARDVCLLAEVWR